MWRLLLHCGWLGLVGVEVHMETTVKGANQAEAGQPLTNQYVREGQLGLLGGEDWRGLGTRSL